MRGIHVIGVGYFGFFSIVSGKHDTYFISYHVLTRDEDRTTSISAAKDRHTILD